MVRCCTWFAEYGPPSEIVPDSATNVAAPLHCGSELEGVGGENEGVGGENEGVGGENVAETVTGGAGTVLVDAAAE